MGRRTRGAWPVAVAVLILVIACINYVNMSTADATRRAREVALRKVSGAQRGQLVAQFIGGSVMIALIGIAVALVLLWLLLPAFNGITEKEIGMGHLVRGSFVAVYEVLNAMGLLSARRLGLPVELYDPETDYREVRDRWFGISIPDE